MDIYGRIEDLLNRENISAYKLSKETGISTGLLSQWKKRSQTPSTDKLQKIADYFNVSVDYLLTGEQKEQAPIDVVDEDLRDYLDELRNRPEMRMLFSTTKTATKAQIEAIVKMVEEMQGNK